MKRAGVLHARLSFLIASLGHKDSFMIGDAGMPIPLGVEIVDLALAVYQPLRKRSMRYYPKQLLKAIPSRKKFIKKIRYYSPTCRRSFLVFPVNSFHT